MLSNIEHTALTVSVGDRLWVRGLSNRIWVIVVTDIVDHQFFRGLYCFGARLGEDRWKLKFSRIVKAVS